MNSLWTAAVLIWVVLLLVDMAQQHRLDMWFDTLMLTAAIGRWVFLYQGRK